MYYNLGFIILLAFTQDFIDAQLSSKIEEPYVSIELKETSRMNNLEIEVKLRLKSTSSESINLVKNTIDQLASKYQGKITTAWNNVQMHAIYYDTLDQDLQKEHACFRIRQENSYYLATFKGELPSADNIAKRLEINIPLANPAFNWNILQNNEATRDIYLKLKDKKFIEVVQTQFQRECEVITLPHSKLEIAIDRGKIIAGGHMEEIAEVEIELLEGSMADLRLYQQELLATSLVTDQDCKRSKYKRGLDLAKAK